MFVCGKTDGADYKILYNMQEKDMLNSVKYTGFLLNSMMSNARRSLGAAKTAMRFAFCQNDYILRTSCILGGGT